jgi:hypothetical protein
MDIGTYRQLLAQIRDLLLGVGDTRWGPRLQSWIAELDGLQTSDEQSMMEHVRRTRRSVAGMGSMGDIVICVEAGHHLPDDQAEVNRLNAQLQKLVHSLFLTCASLLNERV